MLTKQTLKTLAPLAPLALCALALAACSEKRPSTTGPRMTNAQNQLLRLNEPYTCITAKAGIESMINQDRATAARVYPELRSENQRMLDEVLTQFSAHARCAAAVPSYGKKLARGRAKALEKESTQKFYAHIHSDILASTVAAAEKLYGAGNRCAANADPTDKLDPVTDLTIECILPSAQAKQYIAFVGLDQSRGAPMLLAWRESRTDSAVHSIDLQLRYSLEVRADLWHAFKTPDGLKDIESDNSPSFILRNRSSQQAELAFDSSRAGSFEEFKKGVFGKLLPSGCPRD